MKEKKKKTVLLITDPINLKMFTAIAMLVMFGLVMVFSASSFTCATSEKYQFDSAYLLKRQAAFSLTGFVGMFFMQFFPYRKLKRYAFFIYLLGIALIFALLTPLGVEVNHATRWLDVGIRFQVAEVVKFTLIVFLAAMINYFRKYLNKWRVLIGIWVFGSIPAVLLYLISNDLSSALVLLGITFGMTYIYSKKTGVHVGILTLGVLGTVGLRMSFKAHLPSQEELNQMSFRYGRIAAWISPESYPKNQGYQTLQALYAIGTGGAFGKGLGRGVQKISKIPEAQNDMIFSVVCEELGIVGAAMLLFLFGYLIYQMIRVSLNVKDLFASCLVTGIWLQILIQVLINVCVCMNVIPNTGISLPFISYGGTSLLLLMLEIGFVFSVFRRMQRKTVVRDDIHSCSKRKQDENEIIGRN